MSRDVAPVAVVGGVLRQLIGEGPHRGLRGF
jgi:hypothetical protein